MFKKRHMTDVIIRIFFELSNTSKCQESSVGQAMILCIGRKNQIAMSIIGTYECRKH